MVERLCTAPSVGPVTAAAFSSTVDDAHRFKSAH
jgi:transposase